MARVTISESYPLRLYKTPAIEKFFTHFESRWPELRSKVQFKIDLIGAGFLSTPKDQEMGPVGWAGCDGLSEPKERPWADPKLLLLRMDVLVDDSFPIPHIDRAKLTPGGHDNFLLCSWMEPITEPKEVTMGVYKNKIFTRVFEAIREVNPRFTEEDLAYYGVEDRYYGPDDNFTYTCPIEEEEVTPITTYQKHETVSTGKSTLVIQLRECDLWSNLEELDRVFEKLS